MDNIERDQVSERNDHHARELQRACSKYLVKAHGETRIYPGSYRRHLMKNEAKM